MIKLNSRFAKTLGFTSDKFDGYLWEDGDMITISVINSLKPGQGNLKKLFNKIESKKYKIRVPTPMLAMTYILTKWGFTPEFIPDDMFGPVEVWEKRKEKNVSDNDSTPT